MVTTLDKIFWMRSAMGAVTGVATQLLFGGDYYNGVVLGMLVYLVSYYATRIAWGKTFKQTELTKLYTTGLGTFVMLYIFFWFLGFTLGLHSLELLVLPLLR